MFLSALEPYVVVILVVIVALQYAFALFCLLKLAYLDISKREYALWNLFILLVFFIGDIAFLIYYFKVGKNKRIPDYVPPVENEETKPDGESEEKAETPEEEKSENAEAAEPTAEEKTEEHEEVSEEKAEENIEEKEEPEPAAEAEEAPKEQEEQPEQKAKSSRKEKADS